jgi:glutamate racemase
VRLTTGACPRFVDFVERGETNSPELMSLAEIYLEPFLRAGVDTLVLGCTHYPLLAGVISYVMGDDVVLVSSADETARDVFKQLAVHDLFRSDELPPPVHHFEATGDPEPFARLGRRFLGPEIGELPHGPETAA